MISMWHEARKQERKIRGMLVDYKKRAERRREYYERIKLDPTQFIQLHGRACKIHLDPAVHFAAEAPGSMMPWRGDKESMIDRFDVRAHLDEIPTFDPNASVATTPEQIWEERQVNYERYRIIVQNDFLGIKEEKFLNQIRHEELYGPVGNRAIEEEKKALAPKKAAIGFDYSSEGDPNAQSWSLPPPPPPLPPSQSTEAEEDSAEDSDSDIDLDLTVDVLSLTNQQQMELNNSGVEFGLTKNDFMSLISRDLEEAEALRVAKEHEDEKAMYSGRKSRKERRALKKKHLDKKMSPPSYAARASPTYGTYQRLSSKSKSPSPPCVTSHVKFITSFGDDSEGGTSDDGAGVIIIPDAGGKKDQRSSKRSRPMKASSPSSRERSRSISKGRNSSSRKKRSRSTSRCRSRSRSTRRDRTKSSYKSRRRSRSYSRSKRRSRSYSRSPDRRGYHGRSRYYRSSRSRSYSRSRSKSLGKRYNSKNVKNVKNQEDLKANTPPKVPSPPRRRYYGRREEKSDSDIDSPVEEEQPESNATPISTDRSATSKSTSSSFGNEAAVDKTSTYGTKLTPKERLRKKMQALLKKQYKADKKLEKEKQIKAEQERLDREEELRGIAIKLRRREREKRHRLHGEDSDSENSSDSRSRSPSASKSDKTIDSPTNDKEPEKEVNRFSPAKEGRSVRAKSKDSLKNRDKYREDCSGYRNDRYKEYTSHRDDRPKENSGFDDDGYRDTGMTHNRDDRNKPNYRESRFREDSCRDDRHFGYDRNDSRYRDDSYRDNRYKEDFHRDRGSGNRDSSRPSYSSHYSRSRDQQQNRGNMHRSSSDEESKRIRLVDY